MTFIPRARYARFTRRPLPPLALTLLTLLVATTFGALLAQHLGDRVVLRLAASGERRAAALEHLVRSGDLTLLKGALESEADPEVRERALDLAPLLGAGAALPLARRLEVERPSLRDLRATAALGDERAIPALTRHLRDRRASPRERAAAFTALAAIAGRHGVPPQALPALAWSEHDLLEELALGVEEEAPPWRTGALRALARNLRASPVVIARHRLRVRELEAAPDERVEADETERRGALALLWLRGEALVHAREHERALAGLLAPRDVLARLRDPGRLDDTLEAERWGGAGEWRRLDALTDDERGRAALRAALDRAPDRTRPAASAAAILLARGARPIFDDAATLESLARSGTLEDLPPPLVLEALTRLGERAVPALVRASGRDDGQLARVLEPGAGTPRERFLLDLAVASISTSVLGCR